MIKIRNRDGDLLMEVDADTLSRANLAGTDLKDAILTNTILDTGAPTVQRISLDKGGFLGHE